MLGRAPAGAQRKRPGPSWAWVEDLGLRDVEEARREKFQRDALKIRETLDDDRSKRIEASATHPQAPTRPESDRAVLEDIARRLDEMENQR